MLSEKQKDNLIELKAQNSGGGAGTLPRSLKLPATPQDFKKKKKGGGRNPVNEPPHLFQVPLGAVEQPIALRGGAAGRDRGQ